MRTTDGSHRHIAVLLTTELACFREVLRGINHYAVTKGTWHLDLFSPFDDFVGLIADSQADGVLLGPVDEMREVEALLGVCPRVVGAASQLYGRGFERLPEVSADDEKVGELAAAHFLDKGFLNFAFLGTDASWSAIRQTGFTRALAAAGHETAVLVHPHVPPPVGRGWTRPHYPKSVAKWLADLPRPLALLAANDLRGRAVAELCREEGIRVPDDVAILGVDDDDLECGLSHPPLSSIAIPWQRIGHEAARLLDDVLLDRHPPARHHLIPPTTVVERQSTDTIATEDADVAAAIQFIREHAHERINVTDVLRAVPTARRSLEQRFRKVLGRTPLDEIRRVHIERAKELLAQTDLAMPDVAERCGFASAAWFSKAFSDLTGMTPTDYRKQCWHRRGTTHPA